MKTQKNIVVVGSANMDLVLPVERLPALGETITGGDLALCPGGKGANQACACGRLGAPVWLVAQVGSDVFGATLLSSLRDAGVSTELVGASRRPSGCASIYVLPSGDNCIVISSGANATLDPDAALQRLNAIPYPKFVLLQLEIPIETVNAVLIWAKRKGVTTILDPAPARPLSAAILRNVDFLTPNQSEAAMLIGASSREIRSFEDAEAAAHRLLELGPGAVVMKLGSLGCLLRTGRICERIEGFQVSAVDTTAAGDAFNGALAVALAEGKRSSDAAAFANAAAAMSVTRHGAQLSLPCREEVDQFLGRVVVTT